ncbi:MAG: restriction endonuclease subunit S [Candidatus Brocadiia bacterium]
MSDDGYKEVHVGPQRLQIPIEWEVKLIKDCCRYVSGSGFPEEYQGKKRGDYPFYKVSDMNNYTKFMGDSNNYVGEVEVEKLNLKTAPKDAVIFPKLGAALETNKRRILSRESIFDNNIAALIATDINNRFLYYVLQTIDLGILGNSGTVPSINKSTIEKLQLLCPPLPEQKKIAAILSRVDEAIRTTEEIIDRTEELKKGLMQDLLTRGIGHDEFKEVQIGPKRLSAPACWEKVKAGDLCKVKGGKRLPKGEGYAEEKTEFPYLRVVDFSNGSIDPSELQYLKPDTQQKIARYTITCKDVFISIAGTIGVVGIVPDFLDNANLTENAAKLYDLQVDQKYLYYYLSGKLGQDEIDRFTIGSTQPKLALKRIKKINVLVPPKKEQKQIASILSRVDEKLQTEREYREELTELKRGLMQDLLTGKVRVTDLPDDLFEGMDCAELA